MPLYNTLAALASHWPTALCALAFLPVANAANVRISAEFRPDPNVKEFVDTTPAGPFCRQFPQTCDRKSLPTQIVAGTVAPITAPVADPLEGLSLKFPADWRSVTVTEPSTGTTRTVELRIVGMKGNFNLLGRSAEDITGISDPVAAHDALWVGGGWANLPAPCHSPFSQVVNQRQVKVEWNAPQPVHCAKEAAFEIPEAAFYEQAFIYEMRTPSPFDMPAGQYEGTLGYSLGLFRDIDYGSNFRFNDAALNVTVSLRVEHKLQVQMPLSGKTVAMEPQGGWQAWTDRGGRPESLYRDVPFQLSTSGALKMNVECEYPAGNDCAIRNASGEQVPVHTTASLPSALQLQAGGPVDHSPLDTVNALVAIPNRYVGNETGELHFEVTSTDMESMLDHPETPYTGNVTVVWDSALTP